MIQSSIFLLFPVLLVAFAESEITTLFAMKKFSSTNEDNKHIMLFILISFFKTLDNERRGKYDEMNKFKLVKI